MVFYFLLLNILFLLLKTWEIITLRGMAFRILRDESYTDLYSYYSIVSVCLRISMLLSSVSPGYVSRFPIQVFNPGSPSRFFIQVRHPGSPGSLCKFTLFVLSSVSAVVGISTQTVPFRIHQVYMFQVIQVPGYPGSRFQVPSSMLQVYRFQVYRFHVTGSKLQVSMLQVSRFP